MGWDRLYRKFWADTCFLGVSPDPFIAFLMIVDRLPVKYLKDKFTSMGMDAYDQNFEIDFPVASSQMPNACERSRLFCDAAPHSLGSCGHENGNNVPVLCIRHAQDHRF